MQLAGQPYSGKVSPLALTGIACLPAGRLRHFDMKPLQLPLKEQKIHGICEAGDCVPCIYPILNCRRSPPAILRPVNRQAGSPGKPRLIEEQNCGSFIAKPECSIAEANK